MKAFFAKFTTWYIIGYIVIISAFAYTSLLSENDRSQLRHEIKRSTMFDDLRAYQLCLSGNEARKAIVDAFHGYTQALVVASASSEQDQQQTPKERADQQKALATFIQLQDQTLAKLGPRDCSTLKP